MLEVLEVQGQELAQGQEAHRGQPSQLEVLDRALDKGLVIERWRSAGVLGIDLLTLASNSVVASFATYLDYAEAIAAIEETASRADTDDGAPM